jgi:hypothetical protein
MSKFHKWLKSDSLYTSKGEVEPIYWYMIGTGWGNDGKALLGWVFGGKRGEGPLSFEPKLFKLKIQVPKNHQRFEKRMVRDVFERGNTLWPDTIRSIKYE